jgi:hypothetical protein
MKTVTIQQTIDRQEFLENLFGSGSFTWSWWGDVKYDEGYDWDKYPETDEVPFVRISAQDPESNSEYKFVSAYLSVGDLVRATNRAYKDGWTLDDIDADCGDVIFQHAVLGEHVYG